MDSLLDEHSIDAHSTAHWHHYKRNNFHHRKFAKSSMALVLAVLSLALAVSIKMQLA